MKKILLYLSLLLLVTGCQNNTHQPEQEKYNSYLSYYQSILDSDIEALIQERQDARKAKNFARADEIRDELLAKGIILKDTREGVKWKRA